MKIVYISNSQIPSQKANSIHVMKMCQAFARNGHEVILIAFYGKNSIIRNENDIYEFYDAKKIFKIIRIRNINNRLTAFLSSVSILIMIYRIKPDLVYGRFISGCYLSSLFGYPTIVEFHSTDWKKSFYRKTMVKFLANSSNVLRYIVISSVLKQLLMKAFPYIKEKIIVAHDGADIVDNIRKTIKWEGRPGRLQIGYTGHLYQGRGIDIIVYLAENIPEMDFHIIGGSEKDIIYWKSDNRQDNLFFYGFVDPNLIPSYRDKCDILLAPYGRKVMTGSGVITGHYMSPLKVFEYMASKKAIIASDLIILREVLNENNAILVNPDKPEEWMKAIKELKNPKKRQSIARNAYHEFKNNYSWKIRAKKVLERISL